MKYRKRIKWIVGDREITNIVYRKVKEVKSGT